MPSCSDRCWQPPLRAPRSRSRHRSDRRSGLRLPQARRARWSPSSRSCLLPQSPARSSSCRLWSPSASASHVRSPVEPWRASRSRRQRSPRFPPAPSSPREVSLPRANSTAAPWPSASQCWAGSRSASSLGAAALGPLGLVPSALRGAGSPWLAVGASGGMGIGLAAAWVGLAAGRAEPRSRRPAAGRSGRRRLPASVAASVLLARRSDLRLATLGASAFGLAGVALAAAGDAPPPAPFLLGTTTALLGSLLCPLVVGGVLDDGRWLWRCAPVRSGAIARSFALASTGAAALPVAVVGGVAAVVSGGGCANPRHRRDARRRRLVRGAARGRLAPVARRGSRRSDDDHRRVRGDRDRSIVRRRRSSPRGSCRSASPTRSSWRRSASLFLAAALAALDRRLGAGGR